MKLENRFTVPVPRDQALAVLLDVERIAPCMPGATLTSRDGDHFTGTVKVKVGPINLTYGGKAHFVSVDEVAGVVIIEGSGKETRGTGTAKALVTCRLVSNGETTDVEVDTDLNVTGNPAGTASADAGAAATAGAAGPTAGPRNPADGPGAPLATAPAAPPVRPRPQPEAIDLLGTAGAPVLKRLAPVLVGVAVLLLVIRRLRR